MGENPWGIIWSPRIVSNNFEPVERGGIGQLINVIIYLLVGVAGLYAVFNFILAGYGFLSAGGDSRKVADAGAKIWQSVLGLAVAAGALVLAAIFGKLIGFDILTPAIPGFGIPFSP